MLICETEDAKRRLFFENGFLCGSKSSRDDERLGTILVTRRKITAEELERAVELIRTGKKLGELLVELGYLEQADIQRYVRVQIVDIARNMLFSAPHRLSFSEGVTEEAVASISILDVFMEAARRLECTQFYRGNLLTDQQSLTRADPGAAGNTATLSPDEASVLEHVGEGKTTKDILQKSVLPEEETIRILIGLMQAGAIEIATQGTKPAPAAKAPPKDDPFQREIDRALQLTETPSEWEIFALEPGASLQALRDAYRTLSLRFHPDQGGRLPEESQKKLAALYSRITAAFNTLSAARSEQPSPFSPPPPEPTEPKQTEAPEAEAKTAEAPPSSARDTDRAREVFQRARHAYDAGDFYQAIELCRVAIELGDSEAEHFHLLGCALGQNSRWRQDAEKNLLIATKLKPFEARYFRSLVELYEGAGLHHRARRTREQLEAIDPTFAMTGTAPQT